MKYANPASRGEVRDTHKGKQGMKYANPAISKGHKSGKNKE
jgi:hypothetical protein